MKKTLIAMMMACGLLMTGCSSFSRITSLITQLDKQHDAIKKQLNPQEPDSPVQDLTTQWINPVPLEKDPVARTPLPDCAIILTRPGYISLAEINSFITQQCRQSVMVTPDAQAALLMSDKKETSAGPPPQPEEGGMEPLSTLVGTTATGGAGKRLLRGIFWNGSLAGLLDSVTQRLGLSWRYEQGHITLFHMDTRTYPVMFMDSKTNFSSKVISGASTTGGSDGSSGTDINTMQSTSMKMSSSLYTDLQNTIQSMLTPGTGRFFLAAGTLTVTDAPHVLNTVGRYMDERNREMSRQVVLKVRVFSVTRKHEDQLGLDLKAVYKGGHVMPELDGTTISNAMQNVMTGGLTILDGKFADSHSLIRALAAQSNLSLITQQASTTTNMSAVPIQVGEQEDYASQVTVSNSVNNGNTKTITKSTITTGFNMTMLPYILPGSSKIELQFSINVSEKPERRDFGESSNKIELMTTRLKTFSQRAILNSGQTLVLSGFQQLNTVGEKRGIGSPSFFGLGGIARGDKEDKMMMVLITPTLLR